MTAVAYADSREECDELLAPFDEGVGRRGFVEDEARRETPQHALYELTGARFPVGQRVAADCLWSDGEPSVLLGTLGSALSVAPSASAWVLVNVSSEQPPLVAPVPAAFSTAGRFYVAVYAVWEGSEATARNQAWLGETMRALEPLASGRYIGEVDLTARPERPARRSVLRPGNDSLPCAIATTASACSAGSRASAEPCPSARTRTRPQGRRARPCWRGRGALRAARGSSAPAAGGRQN